MRELHQTSAFPLAIFIKIWMRITKATTGIILYLNAIRVTDSNATIANRIKIESGHYESTRGNLIMKTFLKTPKILVLLGVEGVILLLCIANLFREKQEIYIKSEKQQINAGTYDTTSGNYIDGQTGYGGVFSLSPTISLPAGSYRICLEYATDTNMLNSCGVQESTGAKGWLLANAVNLYSGLHETDFIIWLLRGNDTIQVYTNYNGTNGYLAVNGIAIHETKDFRLMLLTLFTFVFILVDVICLYRMHVQHEKATRDNRKTVISLTLMIILSSIPLMVNYVLAGDDLAYHLLRLEGLKDGLETGQFPVRLYPKWLAGHGYADSIMYGHLLLYIPAVLRLLGLPLQTCYKFYVLFINVGTCLIAYYSYGKICKNKDFGLLGSLLTLFAPYRLYCVYQRAAVGEYSAIMFLPLLCYGLYRIFSEDPRTDGYRRNWLLPTIAYSGIIHTHVLTCEMAGGFTILLCLILWKKVFRRHTFVVLAKTVVFTVLLNAWFLVPFLEYLLTENLKVGYTSVRIQHKGLFLAHLLQFFPYAGLSQPHSLYEVGMNVTPPLTPGFAVFIGIFVYLCCVWKEKSFSFYKTGKTVLALSVAAIVMSTRYFPWDIIQDISGMTSKIVSSIQFPMRFLSIAIPLLIMITCIAGVWIMQNSSITVRKLYFGSVAVASLFCGLWYENDCLENKAFWRIYDINGVGTTFAMGEEYLPVGTDSSLLRYNPPTSSEHVEITGYVKNNLNIELCCTNNSKETGYVEVPLIFYKGYTARDDVSRRPLEIMYGDNNAIRVLIPADYTGTIQIFFPGMWYWRIAEAISLIAIVGCIVRFLRMHRLSHKS